MTDLDVQREAIQAQEFCTDALWKVWGILNHPDATPSMIADAKAMEGPARDIRRFYEVIEGGYS